MKKGKFSDIFENWNCTGRQTSMPDLTRSIAAVEPMPEIRLNFQVSGNFESFRGRPCLHFTPEYGSSKSGTKIRKWYDLPSRVAVRPSRVRRPRVGRRAAREGNARIPEKLPRKVKSHRVLINSNRCKLGTNSNADIACDQHQPLKIDNTVLTRPAEPQSLGNRNNQSKFV